MIEKEAQIWLQICGKVWLIQVVPAISSSNTGHRRESSSCNLFSVIGAICSIQSTISRFSWTGWTMYYMYCKKEENNEEETNEEETNENDY